MDLIINVIIWIAYVLSLYFSFFLLFIDLDSSRLFKTEESSLIIPHTPLVSILVPAYNEEKTITRTMESIQNIDYPQDKLDVIIINDGSKDKTEQIITEYIKNKPHFRLLSHANRGKAASMNRALELVKGEFFACLDADSFVHPYTLRKMLSLYYKENDLDLAIITPAMKVDNPKNMLQRVQWLEYIIIILISRITSHMDSLYVAPGPFSLYRTSIIKELKGFDEKNITEDQEIAYRVQKHHYKIKQCFDGYVYTTAPAKIKPFYKQRKRWYLGSILCLNQYKDMVANRKYGDFGLMQMVKNVTGFIIGITRMILVVYLFVLPLRLWIKNMMAINFNLFPYFLHRLHVDTLTFLLMDLKKAYIVCFLFAIGLFFFYQAHKNAQEKIMKYGWIPIVPYFAWYYLLKGIILMISLAEFSRNKKVKW